MAKKKQTSLVLRVCNPDFTSRNEFVWPSNVGDIAEAKDWISNNECGNGLHGWLYGQGDHSCTSYWEHADAKWLVLEVESDSVVMLEGKCKFPKATVRFVGSKYEAASFIFCW